MIASLYQGCGVRGQSDVTVLKLVDSCGVVSTVAIRFLVLAAMVI
jgi:hypothetical protein